MSIQSRLAEIRELLLNTPAQAAAGAAKYPDLGGYAARCGALEATLWIVEMHLRHTMEELTGERIPVPPQDWEHVDHHDLELLAGGETALHEDVSIAGVG